MWQDNDSDVDSSHDELVQDYLENELAPAEEKRFRLLLGEKPFRRRVAQFAMDLGHLHDLARQGMLSRTSVERPARLRRRVVAALAAAASVLLALGTIWLVAPTNDRTTGLVSPPPTSPATPTTTIRPAQHPVARVVHVNGNVVRTGSFGSTNEMDVDVDADLFSGDVLKTVSEDSFAVIEFADKSVLAVAGGTELKCIVDREQKRLAVSAGDLMAQVSSQPEGKPMFIETPVADAEVVGTRLSLFANSDLTKLAVLEGEVHLYRRADGRSIKVRSGESVTASADSELIPEPFSPVSSVWEEDFEDGLPPYWRAGEWVDESLPSGSFGAVRAVPSRGRQDDPDGPFRISTMREWTRGLFRIEADTHLNFTYKLGSRGAILIRLMTSTDPVDPRVVDAYEYRNPALANMPHNEWRSVSVPLTSFHQLPRKHRTSQSRQTPAQGDSAIMIGIGSKGRDTGLVVDRIWITYGTPDSIEVLDEFRR